MGFKSHCKFRVKWDTALVNTFFTLNRTACESFHLENFTDDDDKKQSSQQHEKIVIKLMIVLESHRLYVDVEVG